MGWGRSLTVTSFRVERWVVVDFSAFRTAVEQTSDPNLKESSSKETKDRRRYRSRANTGSKHASLGSVEIS